MSRALAFLAVAIGLLSLAAGGAKIALVPEEAAFLAALGFTAPATIAFGVAQEVAGVLVMVPRTRAPGALVVAAGFALSAGLVAASGDWGFAAVSVVPVLLALGVAFGSARRVGESGEPAA